jgi:predicted ATPase/DNA-binding SARP family transcriptional activator
VLSVAVLGEVEATRDGVRLPLPAGKSSELLARLAVQPGVPVRVDVLIEDLWGMSVDRNTLQAKVSQLRRALGGKDLVRGSAEAYVLDLDPDCVDASRATSLARRVAAAAAAGRPADVVGPAEAGAALFRGEPLVGQGDWAAPYRTALDEVRWSLVEELATARVALGGGGELVPELQRLVEEQPLRERLWAALMTALYRGGRQSDALAAYGRARTHLVEELGLEPGPELRTLEAQVLAHGETPGARADATTPPTNLPATVGTIVGRDDELRDVAALLDGQDVVTLVGPAGVGKTRLAVEVARSAPPAGGSWIVRLEGVRADADLADLTVAVAAALHVVPEPGALRERLRGAPTLLVLDNCEHVVGASADLAGWLRDASPWLRLLVTSQVPLGVGDERVVQVAPLAPADAVHLFEQLAARAGRRTDPDDAEERLVAEVCAALDGLPLAIELAAARVRSLPLDEIARRLGDRFALLRDPTRPTDRRHALEAALSWSYDLLFPDDQRALQALSCFPGGATFAAAAAVLEALSVPDTVVADSYARLVDRSLVVLDNAARVPRYRLLDSVRTHAHARLQESGSADAALAAHATWYADRAEACASEIRGPEQARWLDFVRAERADVDAALAWSAAHDRRTGERLALGLGWAWAVLGDGSAGAARLRAAVTDDAAPEWRVRAALVAGWLEASAGDLGLAHDDLRVAATVATADPHLEADLAWTAAFVAIQDGRPADVLDGSERALAAYRRLGLTWHGGAALVVAAYGHLMSGAHATAGDLAVEAVGVLEETGDQWGLLHAHAILGGIAAGEGRLEDASLAFADAADAATRMGFPGQAALHQAARARTLVVLDDPGAAEAVDQALDAAIGVGDGRVAAGLRVHAAQSARESGDATVARRMLEANAEWYAAHGGGDRAALTQVLLCALADDSTGLDALLDQELDPAARQAALDAGCRLASQGGDRGRAHDLAAAADAIVVPVPDFVRRVDRDLVADSAGSG